MSDKPAVCARIDEDLLAAAMGEADASAAGRVERHLAACVSCRRKFQEYRVVDDAVTVLREESVSNAPPLQSRQRLERRLADLRSRLLAYRIFPSPLGYILIARSELGISLVEYLGRGTSLHVSRLSREPGVETVVGGAEIETLYRDLLEYLEGHRKRLDWPLDLRLTRSEFQRAVLRATAAIPYGAVTPYAGIAREIGKASATRAVAQALRWNPLPIVIPCHRVVGTSGALTGYAGSKLDLKQRLLSVEGIPTIQKAGVPEIVPQTMYSIHPGDPEYCLPTCPSRHARQPAPLTRFASREDAEAVGLRPCTVCRPDLHPISR